MSNSHDSDLRIDPETGFVARSRPVETAGAGGADALGQMREILMGPVSRDLQARLDGLEQRLNEIAGELEAKTNARLKEVEEKLRGDLVDRPSLSSMFSELALRAAGGLDDNEIDPEQPDVDFDNLFEARTDESTCDESELHIGKI